MSMVVTGPSASRNFCSTIQWPFTFSWKNVLNVLVVAGAYFQTGITPVYAEGVTIHPATMPSYCRENITQIYGEPIFGNEVNRLCLIDCANLYRQKVADAQKQEELLAAQYKLGKCIACPWLYPSIMDNNVPSEQIKKEKEEHLEGLALVYRSGCLNIQFPEDGETFQRCIDRYLTTTTDISPLNYNIFGCRYFVSGTLICPDQQTFERLKRRFLNRVFS